MISKVLSSIYSWIVIVVLVIVVITANSFYVVSTLNDLSALEARLFTTNRVINAINRLHVAVLRVESGQRGYMLTDDEKYLTDYSESLSVIGELMSEVEVSSFSSDIDDQSVRKILRGRGEHLVCSGIAKRERLSECLTRDTEVFCRFDKRKISKV